MVDNFSIFISWVDCLSRLKSKNIFLLFFKKKKGGGGEKGGRERKKKDFHSSEQRFFFFQSFYQQTYKNKYTQKLSETPEVQQVIHAGLTTSSTVRQSLDTLLDCHMSACLGTPGWPYFSINFWPLQYSRQRTNMLPKSWVRVPVCIPFPFFMSFHSSQPSGGPVFVLGNWEEYHLSPASAGVIISKVYYFTILFTIITV